MITIIFESHSTTTDNRAAKASGWNDVPLSSSGQLQAKELGERYVNSHFDAIFCSDLQRSFKTADIAFNGKFPLLKDSRLRECNYGELNGADKKSVFESRAQHLAEPFPSGESYSQTAQRMKSFIDDLRQNYQGKTVLIIGHRATQYGLEQWLNGKTLSQAVLEPWQWQPGWRYTLD
jgi:broad specificity phosphatase PhoE